jgi:hypothetical protein
MGVASLVLGIIGLLFALIPIVGMYAWPLTVLAVILGYFGMKNPQGRGNAIAGLVLGLLGTALVIFWYPLIDESLPSIAAVSVAAICLVRRAR